MDQSERLAPVIPLFGGAAPVAGARGAKETGRDADVSQAAVFGDVPAAGTAADESVTQLPPTAIDGNAADGDTADGDVTRDGIVAPAPAQPDEWRSSWDVPARTRDASSLHPSRSGVAKVHDARQAPRLRALHDDDVHEQAGLPVDPDVLRASAEELLVRKLRSRSLSISEARSVLRGFESEGSRLDGSQIDDVLDDFCRRGYLDDAVLAEQLVSSGSERKGQGRIALARALAQRGIPRETVDAVIGELPDDDLERALEYARSKMRSLGRLDTETAKRRLSGQLARRGYSGGVVSAVLRTVLSTASSRPSSGVRFE